MIKKSGPRWIVLSKDGKRKLETCFDREEALESLADLKKSGEYYQVSVRETNYEGSDARN